MPSASLLLRIARKVCDGQYRDRPNWRLPAGRSTACRGHSATAAPSATVVAIPATNQRRRTRRGFCGVVSAPLAGLPPKPPLIELVGVRVDGRQLGVLKPPHRQLIATSQRCTVRTSRPRYAAISFHDSSRRPGSVRGVEVHEVLRKPAQTSRHSAMTQTRSDFEPAALSRFVACSSPTP